jgi:SPP1 family predicted phage head-tail adaptor
MKCSSCSAKNLRNKVEILRETTTRDAVGGFSSTWYTHLTVYAQINPVSGTERYYAHRMESNTTHKIITRFCDITQKDRVRFRGREMDIESVINIEERDKWLEINAVENKEQ